MSRVIVTGGPGAGKTTLLAELAASARVVEWYDSCGYDLHEVPRIPVLERADHVLRVLAEYGD